LRRYQDKLTDAVSRDARHYQVGGAPMARRPNYRFDRMERDRVKAAKRAERQKSKEQKAESNREKPAASVDAPAPGSD
jgi:hypothetical protein